MNTTPRLAYMLLALGATATAPLSAHYLYRPSTPLQTAHTAPVDPQHKLLFHSYSSMYIRTADEAFQKHGSTTKPLSALYFNKDEFRLSNIFENCLVPLNTQNYNPYMRISRFRPRVTYSEYGATIGGRMETFVKNNRRWRVGVRAELPFKRREIERKDAGTRGPAETQDVAVKSQKISVPRTGGSNLAKEGHAYRLDLLEALPKDNNFNSAFEHDAVGGNTKFFAKAVTNDAASPALISGAFVHKSESFPPRAPDTFSNHLAKGESDSGVASQITAYLPADLSNLATGKIYEMEKGNKYLALSDDATAKTTTQRLSDQDSKATVWLIPTFAHTTGAINGDADLMRQSIEKSLNMYNENPHEWFHDRNFRFESDHCVGLGDLTLEAYTSYDLTDRLQLRACGGVLLPTAQRSEVTNNPYAIHLGNRGHIELFAGGGLDFIFDQRGLLMLSVDGRYSSAQPATEYMAATATGAQVKNIGPRVCADVAWEEINADGWLHFTHPHTQYITCSVGYSFHCKTRDRLKLVHVNTPSWLGNTYNTTTSTFADTNLTTPDATAMGANTQSLAHTVRSRFSFDVSEWVNLNAGGSFTVAGKNTPQTFEVSAGCVIKF